MTLSMEAADYVGSRRASWTAAPRRDGVAN